MNRSKSRSTNLLKRGGVWYFRASVEGRDVWRSTKTGDKSVAEGKARRMRREIERDGLAAVQKKKAIATIGEVVVAYDAWAKGARIKKATVRNNKAALLRIIREVHGGDPARMSTTVLTPALLTSYAAARIEVAKAAGPQEVNRALNTTAGTVRQGRSLFAQKVFNSGAYDALELPDLKRFMHLALDEGKRDNWTPPARRGVERLRRLLPILKKRRPAAWRALGLMANLGLRRSEVVRARWDQVVELELMYGSTLAFSLGIESKGKARRVEVDRQWWAEMQKTRADLEPWILPGSTAGERDRVLDYTCALLRIIGMDATGKPNHDLRRLQASMTADRHGAGEAQRTMGHADSRTTADYYLAPLRPGQTVRVL